MTKFYFIIVVTLCVVMNGWMVFDSYKTHHQPTFLSQQDSTFIITNVKRAYCKGYLDGMDAVVQIIGEHKRSFTNSGMLKAVLMDTLSRRR
jgi:hypothetical protein